MVRDKQTILFLKKIPEFKTLFLDLGVNPGYEQK